MRLEKNSLIATAATAIVVAVAATVAGPTWAASQNESAALAATGPSQWTGKTLRHPDGGRFDPNVTRWANLVVLVMDEHHVPRRHLPGILAQMQQESSGNPKAVNRWDSNATAGTPSKGLLQVIAPTYRAYAKPGYKDPKYMTVPYTNVYASLNYVIDAYGRGKFASWDKGANQGY